MSLAFSTLLGPSYWTLYQPRLRDTVESYFSRAVPPPPMPQAAKPAQSSALLWQQCQETSQPTPHRQIFPPGAEYCFCCISRWTQERVFTECFATTKPASQLTSLLSCSICVFPFITWPLQLTLCHTLRLWAFQPLTSGTKCCLEAILGLDLTSRIIASASKGAGQRKRQS